MRHTARNGLVSGFLSDEIGAEISLQEVTRTGPGRGGALSALSTAGLMLCNHYRAD